MTNWKWGDLLSKHNQTKHMKYILAKFANYLLLFQKGKLQVHLTRESPKQCVTVNSLENNSGQVILTNNFPRKFTKIQKKCYHKVFWMFTWFGFFTRNSELLNEFSCLRMGSWQQKPFFHTFNLLLSLLHFCCCYQTYLAEIETFFCMLNQLFVLLRDRLLHF